MDTLHTKGPSAPTQKANSGQVWHGGHSLLSPQSLYNGSIYGFPQGHTASLRLPPAERLIAIGDLHGDYDKTRRAFRTAGLIDEDGQWSGGTSTVVQVSNYEDRRWLSRLLVVLTEFILKLSSSLL